MLPFIMKTKSIINAAFITMAVTVALASSPKILAWGQKGHDVTARIAEKHLTPAARHAVDSIFQGRSIVYWANWLDNASHTPEYSYSKTWHYKNIDEGVRYEEAPANPAGDAVTAIKAQYETLADRDTPLEASQLALRMLVHITGDLHMPLHMGHATDLGGNRINVKFFNSPKNLHSVWDTSLPEAAHKWSYTEWADQLDILTPDEETVVAAGTVDDWAKETVTVADAVYKYFRPGANISYNDIARWTPVIESQFLKGGLRLAHLLNSLFDPGYTTPSGK